MVPYLPLNELNKRSQRDEWSASNEKHSFRLSAHHHRRRRRFVAYNAYFIVHQTQTAVVLEFGNPKRVITKPGLYLKMPIVQTVEFFDKRILDVEISSKEVMASDQKRLVVDAFARYKIIDPLLFFQSVTDEPGARMPDRERHGRGHAQRSRRQHLHRRGEGSSARR